MTNSKHELVVVQPNPDSVLEPLTYYDPEIQNAWNEDAHNPETTAKSDSEIETAPGRLLQADEETAITAE